VTDTEAEPLGEVHVAFVYAVEVVKPPTVIQNEKV
jgi:hypothetical protein